MELLDVFNEEMIKIGVMERSEVHKRGFWHQTFHCWFAKKIQGYISREVRYNSGGSSVRK